MKEIKEASKELSRKETTTYSRRGILKGSAALLAGGIAGCVGSAYTTPERHAAPAAPPLPWKWTELDPNEAGRRAYRNYLAHKG
jgi:hypothetical protein